MSVLYLVYFPGAAIEQDNENQNQNMSIIENNSDQAVPWIGAEVVDLTQ
jgi:hypothetical protein